MSLSDANLRYLFALSELAGQGRPVRSMEVADLLGVSRPSVVRVLQTLSERGLVEKAYYGKITLTPKGQFTVEYYRELVDRICADFPRHRAGTYPVPAPPGRPGAGGRPAG